MRQKLFVNHQCVTFAPQTRVAGGDEAGRNEFPWAALILIQVGADQAVCGGTLVSDRWHVARGWPGLTVLTQARGHRGTLPRE